MSLAQWSLLLGLLLITMVLIGTLLARLPLSSALIYLAVGYLIGPGAIGVLAPDPMHFSSELMLVAEIALLVALFTVGLKMGVTPFDRRWVLPLRLAFVSMSITVGLIALVGVFGLGLSPGAAILLGGILAPTDPVLASGVQLETGTDPDKVRFSLAGEGGLNDGSAFPFVMLGLGLLGLHDMGEGARHWWTIDLLWATLGGMGIGAALGALIGWLVVRLRTRHKEAVGLDEFLSLGLIALAYGAAQLCLASGFLAVFAAGVALQRVKEQPRSGTRSLEVSAGEVESPEILATHSHHASSAMSQGVQYFNEQLEKIAELAIVLIVGAMLPYAFRPLAGPPLALWWFVPTLFVLLRPLAVAVGTLGTRLVPGQRSMISWFGIRGIGSIFYLLFAIQHGVNGELAQQLVTLTLITVAASIVAHGVTAQPMMKGYLRYMKILRLKRTE